MEETVENYYKTYMWLSDNKRTFKQLSIGLVIEGIITELYFFQEPIFGILWAIPTISMPIFFYKLFKDCENDINNLEEQFRHDFHGETFPTNDDDYKILIHKIKKYEEARTCGKEDFGRVIPQCFSSPEELFETLKPDLDPIMSKCYCQKVSISEENGYQKKKVKK